MSPRENRTTPWGAPSRPGVTIERFAIAPGERPIDAVTLTNAAGLEVCVFNYGGIVRTIRTPDRNGVLADITLGYDSFEPYLHNRPYFGALIGRYANRIADGRFALNGQSYTLARNDPPNHLHGGISGFDRVIWDLESFERTGARGAVLSYTSPDREEGYPGRLYTRVTCTLTDDGALAFDFHATSDAPTVVNIAQHSYFNLAGEDAGNVYDHELTIHASRFTPVDSTRIPSGELHDVEGTAFDFTGGARIGDRIAANHEQLHIGGGFDHNFVLDDYRADGPAQLAAVLHDPRSGRTLEVSTTQPGLQFYTGNGLSGEPGKGGRRYGRHAGVALEAQHFPDSPNHPEFPPTTLLPGETYTAQTVYRFSAS